MERIAFQIINFHPLIVFPGWFRRIEKQLQIPFDFLDGTLIIGPPIVGCLVGILIIKGYPGDQQQNKHQRNRAEPNDMQLVYFEFHVFSMRLLYVFYVRNNPIQLG